MRILIAEDDAMSALVLQAAVEQAGHHCVHAPDGLQAWSRYKREAFDVVISDWMMPGIDGVELCRRVRSLVRPSYTYFIFVTGLTDKSEVLAGIDAGADDYLTKPLDPGELHVRLRVAARVTALYRQLGEQRETLRSNNERLAGAVAAIRASESKLAVALEESARARATLVDAMESLSEAFALFDADDRLVLCNRRFARAFTTFEQFADIEGMTFADLVRTSVAKGEKIGPEFHGDVEAWVAARVRAHRNPQPEGRMLELGHGRWLHVTERRTRSGGIVGVRRDITEQRELEQRQRMQHAITALLAQSETVAEVVPAILQTICEAMRLDCGARWVFDERDQRLHFAESWGGSVAAMAEYLASSSELTLAPEDGSLIGRTWLRNEPLWIADLSADPAFIRKSSASAAGLRSALAFPVQIGTSRYGVIEFYTRDMSPGDPALLDITRSIGWQLGQFIARKSAEERTRQLAHYDPLTGLPNRNLFEEFLNLALIKAERRGASLALLFIDLDGFKNVNDNLGHDAGDAVLAMFAQRMRNSLRRSDATARLGDWMPRADTSETPARLGGDEFIVLVDDFSEPQQLSVVAQKVLAAAKEPFVLSNGEVVIGASIGISVYPADGRDAETLLKSADTAMYRAKQGGKNSYRLFSEPSYGALRRETLLA